MTETAAKRSGPLAIRIRDEDLAAIDKRAKRAGLSRNAYIIRASLGELHDPSVVEARLDDLQGRVERLEHYQGLGA